MSASSRHEGEPEPSDAEDRPVPLDEPSVPDPPIDDDEEAERPLRDAEQRSHSHDD